MHLLDDFYFKNFIYILISIYNNAHLGPTQQSLSSILILFCCQGLCTKVGWSIISSVWTLLHRHIQDPRAMWLRNLLLIFATWWLWWVDTGVGQGLWAPCYPCHHLLLRYTAPQWHLVWLQPVPQIILFWPQDADLMVRMSNLVDNSA